MGAANSSKMMVPMQQVQGVTTWHTVLPLFTSHNNLPEKAENQ